MARRRPWELAAAVVLVAGANLSTVALKSAFAESRIQPLLGWDQIGRDSFPSGHATAVAAISLAFLLVVPPARRPAALAVGALATAATASAAVVLHWHYPSEVVAGVLVAAAWYFALSAALAARREETLRRRARPGAAPARSR